VSVVGGRFAVVVLVVTALRLHVMTEVPLTGAEAYYWQWSRHLALGYYDHPPMVAWLIALSTAVFGTSVFSVRLMGPLCSALMTLIVWRLARKLTGSVRVAQMAGLLVLVTPFISVSAMAMTPDSALLPAWAGCVYLLRVAISESRRAWWFAGIALGIGILCKLMALLLVPSLFAYLLLSPTDRRWLRRKEPYLFVLVGLMVASPFLWWNVTHDWQALSYQANYRFGSAHITAPSTRYLGDFFLQQAVNLSPIIFVLAMFAAVRCVVRGVRREGGDLFLGVFGGVMISFFTLTSLYTPTRGYWAMPAHIVLLVAIPSLYAHLGSVYRVAVMSGIVIAGTMTATVYALLIRPQTAFDLVSRFDIPTRTMNRPDTLRAANLAEIFGYEGAGRALKRVVAEMSASRPSFVITDTHERSSLLAFYSGLETHVIGSSIRGRAYDEWSRLDTLAGHDAVFVDVVPYGERPYIVDLLRRAFASVETDPPLHLMVGAQPIRPFYFFRCRGFRPDGLDANRR